MTPIPALTLALTLQAGRSPSRGTFGTVMKHKPFNELKRLGFPAEAEAEARQGLPGETGMLVVDEATTRDDTALEPLSLACPWRSYQARLRTGSSR